MSHQHRSIISLSILLLTSTAPLVNSLALPSDSSTSNDILPRYESTYLGIHIDNSTGVQYHLKAPRDTVPHFDTSGGTSSFGVDTEAPRNLTPFEAERAKKLKNGPAFGLNYLRANTSALTAATPGKWRMCKVWKEDLLVGCHDNNAPFEYYLERGEDLTYLALMDMMKDVFAAPADGGVNRQLDHDPRSLCTALTKQDEKLRNILCVSWAKNAEGYLGDAAIKEFVDLIFPCLKLNLSAQGQVYLEPEGHPFGICVSNRPTGCHEYPCTAI